MVEGSLHKTNSSRLFWVFLVYFHQLSVFEHFQSLHFSPGAAMQLIQTAWIFLLSRVINGPWY